MKKFLPNAIKYAVIFLYILVALYLCLCAVKTSDESGEQSNLLADFIDGVSNTNKKVKPESVSLMRKDDKGTNRWLFHNYKVGDSFTILPVYSPASTTYTKAVWAVDDEEVATITVNGYITFKKEGTVTVTMVNSAFPEINATHEFNITKRLAESVDFKNMINAYKSTDMTEGFNLYVGDEVLLEGTPIPTNATDKDVTFSVTGGAEIINKDIDGSSYSVLRCLSEGEINVTVMQDDVSFTRTYNVLDASETLSEFSLINRHNDVLEDELSIFLNSSYYLFESLSPINSRHSFSYSVIDDSVLSIVAGKIIPKKIGETFVTVTDTFSGISKQIKVKIINYYKIAAVYPSWLSIGSIENGGVLEAKRNAGGNLIVLFESGTNYKKVKFSSSNNNIATVDEDGYISAKKVGVTTITLTVNDGVNGTETYSFTLKIVKQTFSDVFKDYYNVIRKLFGHYLAYVMLGLLSAITFSYLKNRKAGIILHFSLGVAMVSITELLQKFTSGRFASIKDVLLNTAGFLTGTVIVAGIFLTVYLIKRRRKKDNQT